MSEKDCMEDIDNKLILKNIEKFKIIQQEKGIKISIWNKQIETIIVPVTINICIDTFRYKIDFLRYCKYIVDILNEGFSGTINSPYRNINNEENFKYSKHYIKKILEENEENSLSKNADIIYDYINKKHDSRIRFYLQSIVYHDVFIEQKFVNNDTEKFLDEINKTGFKIMDKYYKNLNINIIKFNCSTLGVSIFPWMQHITKKISGCMQVFLDFCTIHPDISTNNFNRCRTLIHEVGHIFGLKHSFLCSPETLKVYEALLGKIFNNDEILNSINSENKEDLKKIKKLKDNKSNSSSETINKNDLLIIKKNLTHKKTNIQLYPDIPMQTKPTNYNPFESKKFPFHNNIPSDFACFMDYTPDLALTHFSEFQIKIMHYMIRMFKPYLIKKSKSELENLNNLKVRLCLHKKVIVKNLALSVLLDDSSINKYYVIYDKKKLYKYSILSVDENLKKSIYIEKN